MNKYAYVEPLATDPDYRRMGLARAVVLEGVLRCAVFGAADVFIGSDLEFYQALGFKKLFDSRCWLRYF